MVALFNRMADLGSHLTGSKYAGSTGFSGIIMPDKMSAGGVFAPPSGVASRHRRSISMGIVRIPLNSRKYPGMFATIDETDEELVSQYAWHPSSNGDIIYAKSTVTVSPGRTHCLSMHRLITMASKLSFVDHWNHDGLDNRRSNLRVCTKAQNQRNQRVGKRKNGTGFIGVSRHIGRKPDAPRWQAIIQINKVSQYLGLFDSPEEAARARDAAARESGDPFVVFNFPEEVT